SGRCDTEDFRPRTIVRHRFLFDRVVVSCDHASVDVEPQLALVDSADATEPDLALANLAVPRARGAHDLVRPFDGLPQLRDLAHCLARRLADIEDFLLRNHRPRYTAPLGAKYFANRLPNHGRTEVFPTLPQERFLPRFRDQDVPAGGGDLPDHREALAARRRHGPTLEQRPDRIRSDRGEEF